MENSSPQGMAALMERRIFLERALKAAGASVLMTIPAMPALAATEAGANMTVQEIINLILKEIPGAPIPQTVDTLKSGSPDQTVTGIVTTMFCTVKLIEEAARIGANFIIAHEPSFYNHTDDIHWVQNNSVLEEKQALLKKYGIAIWRFHDYWHSYRPDGIRYGVLKTAGWLGYEQPGKATVQIPRRSLQDLVSHLKSSLHIPHVRVIGDPKQICERVALMPGAAGGQAQISTVETEKPDVLVVGEVHEWETAEYIRDGRALGRKTALIVLGHSMSEEPGMEWLVSWLGPKIPGIKITHITSGNPFTWM